MELKTLKVEYFEKEFVVIEVCFRAYNEFHQEISRSAKGNLSLGLVEFLHSIQDGLNLVTESVCVRVMAQYNGNHIVIGHYFVYLNHVIPISAECFREYSILRQKDGEFI